MKTMKLPVYSTGWFIFRAARSFPKPRNIGFNYSSRSRSDARVIVDQTKKDNSPDGQQDPAHEEKAAQTDRSKSAASHSAKQPDPQVRPTRSTGIEPSGPDGDAPKKE